MTEDCLKTPAAHDFLGIYRDLFDRYGDLPYKKDLTPERFRRCLGNIFIVERVGERFQFRLFGTAISNITDVDHTGQYLDEVLSGENLIHVTGLLQRCLDERTLIASIEHLLYEGRQWFNVEILRSPWMDDDGVPRFVAGTFATIGIGTGKGPKVHSTIDFDFARSPRSSLEVAAAGFRHSR